MSAIQKELSKATKTDIKKGEDRQAFFARLIVVIHSLGDKEFDALSNDAQNWFNDAVDTTNANKKSRKQDPIPEFPDFEEPKAEEAKPSRRRAAAEPEEPVKDEEGSLAIGMTLRVVTGRGKTVEGELVEIDGDTLVLKDAEGEVEVSAKSAKSIDVVGGDVDGDPEPEASAEPAVGDTVDLVTKRGKEYTGEVVEITDDLIVLEIDGKELEFEMDRVASVAVTGGEADEEPEPEEEAKPSRRRATAETPAEAEKPKRSSNPAGVSLGGRIRELMGENPAITKEALDKQLKKEGVAFRDTSLNMIFKDCTHLLDVLKKNKKLK